MFGGGQCGSDALVEGSGYRGWWRARVTNREGEGVRALSKLERDGGHGRCSAVFDGEDELVVAAAAEVEVGVTPGMELGGAAQGLAGADAAGAFLGVVDDDHGDGVTALQFAKIGEQRRHFATGVFIDAMDADEGVDEEQAWPQRCDGLVEAPAIG